MSQQTKKSSNSNMTTIMVALVLCLVCSVLVSAVAVGLKPAQIENQLLDRNKNILVAAGLFDPAQDTNEDVEKRFADFEIKLVDLEKGEYAAEADLSQSGITDVNNYDANQAAKNKALSIDLGNDDPASIGAVPKFAKVYVKNDANGEPELMVLPVHGYGLWGTMYGFLTLESDLNTVKGISWYEHKETPGLGARIEEPKRSEKWQGIHAYDENGEVATGVTKAGQSKDNWVDGISGATLTSVGVRNLIQFWLGDRGYKPFLDNLRGGTPDSAANAQTQTTTGEEA